MKLILIILLALPLAGCATVGGNLLAGALVGGVVGGAIVSSNNRYYDDRYYYRGRRCWRDDWGDLRCRY